MQTHYLANKHSARWTRVTSEHLDRALDSEAHMDGLCWLSFAGGELSDVGCVGTAGNIALYRLGAPRYERHVRT